MATVASRAQFLAFERVEVTKGHQESVDVPVQWEEWQLRTNFVQLLPQLLAPPASRRILESRHWAPCVSFSGLN
jgi:hypothetical protein